MDIDTTSFSIPFYRLKESNCLPKVTWLVENDPGLTFTLCFILTQIIKVEKPHFNQLSFNSREWENGYSPPIFSRIVVACLPCNRENLKPVSLDGILSQAGII